MTSEQHYKKGRSNLEHTDRAMWKIEVSLDDMNPELFTYICERLDEINVNEYYFQSVHMKKNRPGQILNVICQDEILADVIELLFKETTSLGVRYTPYNVERLARESLSVMTEWGEVTVKIGIRNGQIIQFSPEYEECAAIARREEVALKSVYAQARAIAYRQLKK